MSTFFPRFDSRVIEYLVLVIEIILSIGTDCYWYYCATVSVNAKLCVHVYTLFINSLE